LQELEKERECIEEEKAQVERYKQLLLKQRDIMIALTQRLNERDEQIMALQVSRSWCSEGARSRGLLIAVPYCVRTSWTATTRPAWRWRRSWTRRRRS
jgi:hypothetical protein